MNESEKLQKIADNFAVAEAFYGGVMAGLTEGDWSSAESVMADDCTIYEADSLPFGGTYKGVEGLIKLITSMATEHYTDFTFEIVSQTASEHHVVTGFRLAGKTVPLGTPFTHEVQEIIDIVDGRITRCRPFYWDTKEFAAMFPE